MEKGPLVQKRQMLYKTYTPPWKDTYRKRCRDRLKNSREKFLDRLRGCDAVCEEPASSVTNSVVEDLMQEEWKNMRCEQQGLHPLQEMNGEIRLQEDEYMSIFQEIRAELIREEQQILAEYEAGLHHEEAALESNITTLCNDITCPMCKRNPLHLNKGVVFCSCGVRLDTEQDCLTLENIRHNLEEGPRQHNPACPGQAVFHVVDEVGIQNMMMTCTHCDFMHIII